MSFFVLPQSCKKDQKGSKKGLQNGLFTKNTFFDDLGTCCKNTVFHKKYSEKSLFFRLKIDPKMIKNANSEKRPRKTYDRGISKPP